MKKKKGVNQKRMNSSTTLPPSSLKEKEEVVLAKKEGDNLVQLEGGDDSDSSSSSFSTSFSPPKLEKKVSFSPVIEQRFTIPNGKQQHSRSTKQSTKKDQSDSTPSPSSSSKSSTSSSPSVKRSILINRISHESLQKTQFIYSSLAFLISFMIFMKTLYPVSPPGDSAELIAVANQFGQAHPPGYPLHTLLGKIFISLFPVGGIAYRLNVLTALCSSFGIGFFCCGLSNYLGIKSVLTISTPPPSSSCSSSSSSSSSSPSSSPTSSATLRDAESIQSFLHTIMLICLLTSTFFAFNPTFWLQSIGAEVFALNNFFVGLLIFLLSEFQQTKNSTMAYLGAFSIALGLGNQHTLVLFGVPFCIWVLFTGRSQLLGFKPLFFLLISFLLGLSIYLQLPVGSGRFQSSSWGDSRTFEGFKRHFLREEYGTLKLAPGNASGMFKDNTIEYLTQLWRESSGVGLILALLGVVPVLLQLASFRFSIDSLDFIFLFSYLFYIGVFHSLANLDHR
jgi:hypothetical protein